MEKNFLITITCKSGKEYKFLANDVIAKKFEDFVNGISKEQFFTVHSDEAFFMVSRKYIEYVLFVENKN